VLVLVPVTLQMEQLVVAWTVLRRLPLEMVLIGPPATVLVPVAIAVGPAPPHPSERSSGSTALAGRWVPSVPRRAGGRMGGLRGLLRWLTGL